MQKSTIIKKIALIFSLITINILILTACGKKEEDYRQIQVYKIDGTATVARAGSNMDVYENMQLQSGDIVETAANSYVQLKLDEDKYILLEPETKISLQATGDSADSNTAIFLEKGAIVNQLDNPLSEKSDYQVTTPNSTMAVRGTTFRVEITYDENGESFAKVAVYGGKVECMLVFPDGSVQEPVMIEGNTEVLVRGDSEESEYVMTTTTSYEELREKVLEFLEVAIERGEELSISQEEIEVLIEAQQALEEGDAEVVVEENSEEELSQEETMEEEKQEEQIEENQLQETPQEELENETEEKKQEEQKQETQQPVTTPDNSGSDGDSSSSGSSSSGGSSSGGSSGSGEGDSSGGDGNSGGSGDASGDTGNESTGDSSSTKDVTVQFFNRDNVLFAEKIILGVPSNVKEISLGELPLLQPELDGGWIYNGSRVKADTLLEFEEGKPVTITWGNIAE